VASYFAHMMYARELVLVGLVVVLTSQVTQKKKKAHNTVIVFLFFSFESKVRFPLLPLQ